MLSKSKGYDISIGIGEEHVLTVRAWGVWKTEDQILARNFTRELQEQVENVCKDGEEWCVCEDLVRLPWLQMPRCWGTGRFARHYARLIGFLSKLMHLIGPFGVQSTDPMEGCDWRTSGMRPITYFVKRDFRSNILYSRNSEQ